MDQITLAKYRTHMGQDIEYYKQQSAWKHIKGSDTKRYRGRLAEIKFSEKKGRFYAVIQRLDSNVHLTVDTVPIENVILNNNFVHASSPAAGSSSQRRWENTSNSSGRVGIALWTNNSTMLQYGQDRYKATSLQEMKIGDEVVWLRETKSPLIGKVNWIGGKVMVDGRQDIVAVVQFDQPTNDLPRYIQHAPVNRNIVSVNELLHLPIWLETYNQTNQMPESFENEARASPVVKSKGDEDLINFGDEEEDGAASIDFLSSTDSSIKPHTSTSSSFRWDSKISPYFFYLTVSNGPKHDGVRFGIQGLNNSCFMDATIFSLFAFNNSLDPIIAMTPKFDGDNGTKALLAEVVKNVLKLEIIMPLREKYFVCSKSMGKLRDVLVRTYGPQYQSSFMDAEEFILAFFHLIYAPELLRYNHGGKDFMHQVVLPLTWRESQKRNYLTLQSLLEMSFTVHQVKLAEIPTSAFIIKLPVSGGKLVPCNAVIPNATLDISKIIEGQVGNEVVKMHLHAVICLRNNHFVTFVCMDHTDDLSPWVFMDSKPLTSQPEVHILDGVSGIIKQAERDTAIQELTNSELSEPQCNGFKLFRDAYICVYVPF